MIHSNLIAKKRDGKRLSKKEIHWLINSFLNKEISDSQMSSFLMTIFFRGMDTKEISSLVNIMIDSGSKLDFSESNYFIADKHSTGGIGDKTSLILAPILGSLGIKVPMIAGRALAFTGGTIDKLESISGFQSKQSLKKFKALTINNNCAIICQSDEICPADQEIYRLRDLTATIPSFPLITSSIMSKKISEGINTLVLDIKIGNGAFMKTLEEGQALAKMMKETGNEFNLKTDFIFSSMDQPLGKYAGLACEINESIDTLSGNGPEDLIELTLKLGSKILIRSGIANSLKDALTLQKSVIKDGSALKKFKTMIHNQGGDLYNFKKLNQPKYTNYITAKKDGYLSKFNTEGIGWSLVELGCGYKFKKSKLDNSSGIEFIKKIGDQITKGEKIYRIFNSNRGKLMVASKLLEKTFKITEKNKSVKLIIDES